MSVRRVLSYVGFALGGAVLARTDLLPYVGGMFVDLSHDPWAVGCAVVLAVVGAGNLLSMENPARSLEDDDDDLSLWARSDGYRAARWNSRHSDLPTGVGLARTHGEAPGMHERAPEYPRDRDGRDDETALRALDECGAMAIDLYALTGSSVYLDRIGLAVDRDGRIDGARIDELHRRMRSDYPHLASERDDRRRPSRSPSIVEAYEQAMIRHGMPIPTIHAWWMKRIDRSLWYAFLNAGRGPGALRWPEGMRLSERISNAVSDVPSDQALVTSPLDRNAR